MGECRPPITCGGKFVEILHILKGVEYDQGNPPAERCPMAIFTHVHRSIHVIMNIGLLPGENWKQLKYAQEVYEIEWHVHTMDYRELLKEKECSCG